MDMNELTATQVDKWTKYASYIEECVKDKFTPLAFQAWSDRMYWHTITVYPISVEVKHICHLIGLYYLEKNEGSYLAAEDEIERLRIAGMAVEGETVTLVTSRPGLVIGKRGENFEKLTAFLTEKMGMPYQLRVVEATEDLTEYLIPREALDEY